MSDRNPKYTCWGWKLQLSPGNWRSVEIYFRLVGHSIQLLGCDIFDDERQYLGWLVRENIDIEQQHVMKAWLKRQKTKWVKLHGSDRS